MIHRALTLALLAVVLAAPGYVEGQNVVIEWRHGNGRADSLGELAAQLVRLRVDVILAGNGSVTAAAQRADACPLLAKSITTGIVSGTDGLDFKAARPSGGRCADSSRGY